MSWRTSAHGASIAFRLRQLSEVLRAFRADAQGRQRVRFDPFGAPSGNDRYLRIAAVHCVVFVRQQSPKRSPAQHARVVSLAKAPTDSLTPTTKLAHPFHCLLERVASGDRPPGASIRA
jgi:hypothetical protein